FSSPLPVSSRPHCYISVPACIRFGGCSGWRRFRCRWGLQICKDMDFPELSREYALQGANLLLVPAWDFNLDRWLHARMAVLRAVENGFALARSARNGLLTLSDNRGRIV